jgi:hypothetical protein
MKKDLIKLLLKNIKFDINYISNDDTYSASYDLLKIKSYAPTEDEAIAGAKIQLEAELNSNSKFLEEFKKSLITQ